MVSGEVVSVGGVVSDGVVSVEGGGVVSLVVVSWGVVSVEGVVSWVVVSRGVVSAEGVVSS